MRAADRSWPGPVVVETSGAGTRRCPEQGLVKLIVKEKMMEPFDKVHVEISPMGFLGYLKQWGLSQAEGETVMRVYHRAGQRAALDQAREYVNQGLARCGRPTRQVSP